jgi:aerobic carbon-monoxide dehydrogenase small subunit
MSDRHDTSAPGAAFQLSFSVNGRQYQLGVEAGERLLDVLRSRLGLLGTKEGCGIGECGACTVIMNGKKVNSCMVLAAQAQGAEVLTIEGLEQPGGQLHPLQEAFIEAGAVQCGFCTPGMIMSSYELLLARPQPTPGEIRRALSGNLCRCTGYRQIVDAVQLAARKMSGKDGNQQ